MISNKIFFGKGIEVNQISEQRNCLHKYLEPGNLYLLHNQVGIEKFDWLYASTVINETKYFRILLYEWFLVVKKGGYLIFEIEDNPILDFAGLIKEIALMPHFQGRYEIVEEENRERRKALVIRKTKSIVNPQDDLEKWTFGIVTNGKRKEFLRKSIESIRALKISHYEIIICGTYFGPIEKDIKYISFTEKDNKGWITKKKNLICENAQYGNIVIVHDRIYFDKKWLSGMKKWGNCFDVLSSPVMMPGKCRVKYTNWEAVGDDWRKEKERHIFHSNAGLDPSDWDLTAYVGGPYIALKKSIWKIEKWNENLFWGDAEDIEYSLRQQKRGIMIRFNPYSLVHSQSIPGIFVWAMYEKNLQKTGKYQSNKLLELFFKFFDLLGLRRNQKIMLWLIKMFKKIDGAADWRMKPAKQPL